MLVHFCEGDGFCSGDISDVLVAILRSSFQAAPITSSFTSFLGLEMLQGTRFLNNACASMAVPWKNLCVRVSFEKPVLLIV